MCFRGPLWLHANLVNSNLVRAVRRCGNLNNGANYGPRYVNANNAPSNSNWNYGGGQFLTQSKLSIKHPCTSIFCGSERNRNTIRLDRLGRAFYVSKAPQGVWESKG